MNEIIAALSAAGGTLLYGRYVNGWHALDWKRAVCVGVFCLAVMLIKKVISKK
jgi:hypothetical protein